MKEHKKIIILHGWTYVTKRWDPFIGILACEGITAELLKIPGLTAPLEHSFDLNDYVDWLAGILEKEKTPVTILGHSNGGRIGIAYAAKYPEKVTQLILIDSAGLRAGGLYITLKRRLFSVFAKAGKKAGANAVFSKWLYKLAREHDYEKANPVMKETMKNLICVDLTQTLSKIKVPVTIIWGESDRITPMSDAVKMKALIPNSYLHTIPQAGHSPQYTYPEKVARILIKDLV